MTKKTPQETNLSHSDRPNKQSHNANPAVRLFAPRAQVADHCSKQQSLTDPSRRGKKRTARLTGERSGCTLLLPPLTRASRPNGLQRTSSDVKSKETAIIAIAHLQRPASKPVGKAGAAGLPAALDGSFGNHRKRRLTRPADGGKILPPDANSAALRKVHQAA